MAGLSDAAVPHVEQLSGALGSLPHAVLMTDAAGVTLTVAGKLRSTCGVALEPGCCWLELPESTPCADGATASPGHRQRERMPSAFALVLSQSGHAAEVQPDSDPQNEQYTHRQSDGALSQTVEVHHAQGPLCGFTTVATPVRMTGGATVAVLGLCIRSSDLTAERRLLIQYASVAIAQSWACPCGLGLHDPLAESQGGSIREAPWFDRRLLELLPAAVYVCDTQGEIRYFNDRAAELWGRVPKLGEDGDRYCASYRVYTPEGIPYTQAQLPMVSVLKTGNPVRNCEAILERPDGSRITVMVNIEPIRDDHNHLLGAVNIFQDISDRIEAEKVNGLLAAIVESSDDAIISKSFDGYITSWNAGAERLYGYSAEEAIGKPVAMLCTSQESAEIPSILDQVRRSKQLKHYETTRIRKDGSLAEVSVTVSPVKNASGQIVGASAIARDITDQKRLERERHANEERLQMALQAGRMGTWDWDLRHDRLQWSPGMEVIHGLAPGTFPGTFEAFRAGIHPDDRDGLLQAIEETIRTGREYEHEYRLIWPDGSIHWVEARGRVIRDAAGQAIQMLGICMEVTDRKRTEHDLRFLADASRSLVTLKDSDATLRGVTQVAVPNYADWCAVYMARDDGHLEPQAVAHVNPEKVAMAQHLLQHVSPDSTWLQGIQQAMRAGDTMLVEEITDELLRNVTSDEAHLQQIRSLGLKSFLCVPLAARRQILGVMLFASAESGRRYRQSDLSVAADLARRVAVAIENARLYEELQETARRKDEFLAMLAHELRNPLAPIRSGIDVLRLRGGDDDIIHLMQEQVEHLARLVDDLLDVSRIMRGKVQLRTEDIELASMASRALDSARPFIESQGHQLNVSLPDSPIWVEGDAIRLAQVLTNLLHNAAKYTDRGGQIWFTLRQQDHEAVFSVRDTGIGIPKSLLPHVFDLFIQADRSLERSQGGLGIGLTLVRNLVELHGGSVIVNSPGENQGSEFIVRLPTVAGPHSDQHRRDGAVATPACRRVLIVDDNLAAAKMLAMLIKSLGVTDVKCACDGPSGLQAVDEFRPELVLLDIGLPGMDGYEVGKAIREQRANDSILLVALTGYGQPEDRRKSKDLGFDDHLVKPLAIDSVRDLLRHPKLQARDAGR